MRLTSSTSRTPCFRSIADKSSLTLQLPPLARSYHCFSSAMLPVGASGDKPGPLARPAMDRLSPPLFLSPQIVQGRVLSDRRFRHRILSNPVVLRSSVLHGRRQRHAHPGCLGRVAQRSPSRSIAGQSYHRPHTLLQTTTDLPWPFSGRHQLGLVSLTFRQTNIVWLAFIAGSALLDRLAAVSEIGKTVAQGKHRRHLRREQKLAADYDSFCAPVRCSLSWVGAS